MIFVFFFIIIVFFVVVFLGAKAPLELVRVIYI